MAAVAAAAVAALSVAGGVIGARGAIESGNAAYKMGQVEYGETLNAYHYKRKAMHRQAIEAIHMQVAQWGGSGASAGVGSAELNVLKSINDLQEDTRENLRTSRSEAWKHWMAGSQQLTASRYQATGSLLSGITGAATSYKAMK